MKDLQKLLIIFLATMFFSITLMGNSFDKEATKVFLKRQGIHQAIQKYLAAENTANGDKARVGLADLFNQIKAIQKSHTKINNMKSSSSNTNQLDSLLVERWNESTGQLEPSQLEKWTWNENDLGKSWELYDLDTLTGQWLRNDKEEYEWDSNGNKTTHLDFNPKSTGTGWYENALEHYNYNESGQLTLHLLKMKDTLINDWVNTSKTEYTYDEFGNETLGLHSIVDSTNNWVNYFKEEFAFDENGYNTYMGICEWNNTFNTWDTTIFNRQEYDEYGYVSVAELWLADYFFGTLVEYVNDSMGNPLQTINYAWDFSQSSYIKSVKNNYTLNANGKRDIWTQFVWNSTTNMWIPKQEISYKYDTMGNKTEDLLMNWNATDSVWTSYKKYEYNYDKNGNMNFRQNYAVLDSTEKLYNDYIETLTYDNNKNLIGGSGFRWNLSTNNWDKHYYSDYRYDVLGNLSFREKNIWNDASGKWEGEFKDAWNFDQNNNKTYESNFIWNDTISDWQVNNEFNSTFDPSVQFTDIIYPPEYEYWHISNLKDFDQYANMMLQKTYSEVKDGQLVVSEKFNFFYSPLSTTGIAQIQPMEIKVYPNPADNYLIFDGINSTERATVNLYNLQGKKLLSEELNGNNKVMLSRLKSGIYIYELKKGTEIFRGKIIKK